MTTAKRNGEMIKLICADGAAIEVYHVKPKGAARGGLILLMEIFGVTEHIKELCDGYAEDGFEVISPALYDRIEHNFQASYDKVDIERAVALRDAHKMSDAVIDVQSCIDFLKENGIQKICITGFCYGGSVTWVAACRCRGLAAAAAYYGRAIIEYNGEVPVCPTILHFGEMDQSIPMSWVEAIKTSHPEVTVYTYPAGHGFNSDRRKDYDEKCAKRARERTLNLFNNAL